MSLPRVLVADDQTDILQALRLLLGDAGFDTDLVSSVDDVVERVSQRAVRPAAHGSQLHARHDVGARRPRPARSRPRRTTRTLPVVVMTGWGSIDTAVEAMRRGARSFVQKPWDDTTLVEVVRREVDEGRRRGGATRRLAREHDEARLIQRALLPSAMPDVRGCELARAVDAGVGHRRRLLRRPALQRRRASRSRSPTSSAKGCRPRC